MYQFLDTNGHTLYVGKARDLKKRVASYFTKGIALGNKTQAMLSRATAIKYTPVASELESLLLEASYIKKFSPPYNIRLTDGKAYPLIRIPIKDDYPSVLVARRPEDKNSLYFGPYPNAGAMRLVLRTIRKIIPYQSVSNHPKKFCLYHHLGLCPCPSVTGTTVTKQEYRKNIKRIVHILDGNIKQVLKELETERDELSKNEDFEKASALQKRILALTLITQKAYQPFEYEVNPNLKEDNAKLSTDELAAILHACGVPVQTLHRIECYDISNISGTLAVGSMVVVTNGEKDSSAYRRFRMRTKTPGPNDFIMMEETITRRLKHTEWPLPDLIIADGGKGQITSAIKAVAKYGYPIPVVGLAKREEIIITANFQEIILPKSSLALQLMMRIRDEAHRFAITYHRKLRSQLISG